jgi:hypothetical protein
MSSAEEEAPDTVPDPFPETAAEIEGADWPGRTAEVVQEFTDGGSVVRFSDEGEDYQPLSGEWYYVPPEVGVDPDVGPWGDWYEVRDSYGGRDERKRRALLIGRLNEQTGFWFNDSTTSGNAVPVRVAVDGQKALAAYLFAMSNLAPEAIAEKMNKSSSTVRQYLSDYKAGRTD